MNSIDLETDENQMSKGKKTALLLVALGGRFATEVMQQLEPKEVRKISFWINQMEHVPHKMTEQAVEEFYTKLKNIDRD